MYEEDFPKRLSALRIKKGVSARDMSLSIGQNAGYINCIESGRTFPSMMGFFYICEYLEISPRDFFDFDTNQPQKMNEMIENLKRLDDRQFDSVFEIVSDLAKRNG